MSYDRLLWAGTIKPIESFVFVRSGPLRVIINFKKKKKSIEEGRLK